jgi:hypothetical protein
VAAGAVWAIERASQAVANIAQHNTVILENEDMVRLVAAGS